MIVPMHKVTLLCLAGRREATLDALRDVGVLHLQAVQPAEAPAVDRARQDLARCEAAVAVLQAQKAVHATEQDHPDAAALEEQVHAHAAALRRADERLLALAAEIASRRVLGDFDPARIERLSAGGVPVALWRLARRETLAVPAGALAGELGADDAFRYYAVIGPGAEDIPGAERVAVPAERLSALEQRLAGTTEERDGARAALHALAAALPALKRRRDGLEETLRFAEAHAGMAETGPVAYVQGFCPRDRYEALRAAAARHGWGLASAEPSADDRVPTLMRNPPWARPILALLRMIDVLPGYHEPDISPVFLLAFSLFFAMLVGDAGYGFVFLGLTWLLRRKFRGAPVEPFRLLAILSVATIAWGVLTGNYFGAVDTPMNRLRVDWLLNEQNFMTLCFLIGAVHLTVAHGWRLARCLNSTRALAQAGWIGLSWTMFFAARFLVLDAALPSWFAWLAVPALVLVTVFMTPVKRLKTEWSGHILLPFDVIGNFVDVVSYVRLFAVGSASLAVATAFNEIAVGKGIDNWWTGLLAALVLFVGHAFNIVLCIMSVLVHGVRLNTLEFSNHLGLEWSGFRYLPFARARPQPDS